jgi:hypothetical protein
MSPDDVLAVRHVRRPRKACPERRLRQNMKAPRSRLRELKCAFESAIDRDDFIPGVSMAIDRTVVALERRP